MEELLSMLAKEAEKGEEVQEGLPGSPYLSFRLSSEAHGRVDVLRTCAFCLTPGQKRATQKTKARNTDVGELVLLREEVG